MTILARGRGAAARPKEITLWMPGITHHPPSGPPPSTTHPSTTHPFRPALAEPSRPNLSAVPSAAARLPGPAARLTGPAARLTGPAARLTGPAARLTGPAARSALRLLARSTLLTESPGQVSLRLQPALGEGGPRRRLWMTAKKCQTQLLDSPPPSRGRGWAWSFAVGHDEGTSAVRLLRLPARSAHPVERLVRASPRPISLCLQPGCPRPILLGPAGACAAEETCAVVEGHGRGGFADDRDPGCGRRLAVAG
jgi:hypothetical protein